MRVDFHVHSTASDGTFTPSELAERSRGFAAIALTDHDNTDGLGEWAGIPGIELSIEPGAGFDKFHLLGLGIDPANADEHVHLVKDDGTVAAVATVSASDAQTITCKFPTPPEPGVYTLEVACRNGNRVSLAPAVARLKNIIVK